MYVGRIVAVGCTGEGRLAALYRVSSRSFPNRYAILKGTTAAIIPKPGHEGDVMKNPYIAYNCLRLAGETAVATNGSHTDPIAEKIQAGMGVRDALVSVLAAMDYEHDDYGTPRIAAVADRGKRELFLGIVRKDAVLVRSFPAVPGKVFYVATYEHNAPLDQYAGDGFTSGHAAAACQFILGQGVFAALEKPVTAACAVEAGSTFDVAVAEVC